MEGPALPTLAEVFEHVVAGRNPDGELVSVLFCETIQNAQAQHNLGEEEVADHCVSLLQNLNEFLSLPAMQSNTSFIDGLAEKLLSLGGTLPVAEELHTPAELRLRDWLTLNELLKHTHDLLRDTADDVTAATAHKDNQNMVNAFHMCSRGCTGRRLRRIRTSNAASRPHKRSSCTPSWARMICNATKAQT